MKTLEQALKHLQEKVDWLNESIEEDYLNNSEPSRETDNLLSECDVVAYTLSDVYENKKVSVELPSPCNLDWKDDYSELEKKQYRIRVYDILIETTENMMEKYQYKYTYSSRTIEDFVKFNNGKIIALKSMKPSNLLNAPYYEDITLYVVNKNGKIVYLYVFDGDEGINIIRTEQPATYAEVLKMIDEIFSEEE